MDERERRFQRKEYEKKKNVEAYYGKLPGTEFGAELIKMELQSRKGKLNMQGIEWLKKPIPKNGKMYANFGKRKEEEEARKAANQFMKKRKVLQQQKIEAE